MAKAAQAALTVQVAVFGFDPDPATPRNRALNILVTAGGKLPAAAVDQRETTAAAAARAISETGVDLGRRGSALTLVGLGDQPGRGARTLSTWYSAAAPIAPVRGGSKARWTATGRSLRLDAEGTAVAKAALDRLRDDARQVGGAAALLGEVFTGDDLLRVQAALHGGLDSSERTFRRRVQELRDSGVLKPVKDSEVAGLRQRIARFRSPAGTGGRPPELLRYAGQGGGDDEQLAGLRARRSA